MRATRATTQDARSTTAPWRQVLAAVGAVLIWPVAAVARLCRALGRGLVELWRAIVNLGAEPQKAEDEVPLTQGAAAASASTSSLGADASAKGPRVIGQLHLSRCNETAAQKVHNRSLYLDAMARPGTWGGEFELHLLAELEGVRAQIWRERANAGTDAGERALLCSAVLGASQAGRVVQLELRNCHYSPLLPREGELRCAGGAVRPRAHFRAVSVPGDGDCQFQAFAYAADLPHARRLVDALNGADPAPAATLRGDVELQRHFGLSPDDHASDRAFAVAALATLVARQRAGLVAELAKPAYLTQLDLLVTQELAETEA